MGGFGSGRHGGGRFTDDMRALDARKIHRAGMQALGRSLTWRWTCNDQTTGAISINVEADRVRLSYRRQPEGGECESMNYAVRVDWTPCALGGRCVWWLLVASGGCVLLSVAVGARRCCTAGACSRVASATGLAYRSQRETDKDWATRKADTIRQRLGWEPGILNGDGDKPKGLHWRTYWPLCAQHNECCE